MRRARARLPKTPVPGAAATGPAYSCAMVSIAPRREPPSAWHVPEFRRLWLATTVAGLVQPVHFLTQFFWIQQQYPDRTVLYVGLVAMARGLGMLFMSFAGGVLADRYERRRVLVACECAALTTHALVAVLMLTQPFGQWDALGLAVLAFAVAGITAVDAPSRSASLPSIVGIERVGSAIGLQMVAVQIAFVFGPLATGFANSLFEPGPIYAATLLAWAGVLPAVLSLRYSSRATEGRRAPFRQLREGLAYTARHQLILTVIALVVLLHLIGMPGVGALSAAWMTTVLGMSKTQVGLLGGLMWGSGALGTSLALARRPDTAARGAALCAAALVFALSAVVFSHSRSVPLTALTNFGLGAGVAGTVLCGSTIVQRAVSEEMRGRVMGLFPLAVGLGMFSGGPVSVVSQAFGLTLVVPVLTWSFLVAAGAVVAASPRLRRLPGTPESRLVATVADTA